MTHKKLNINNVKIKTMSTYPKKNKPIFLQIRYDNEQLLIETPKMFAPFGASCYNKQEIIDSGKYPNYDISLSLNLMDSKIQQLHDFFRELDSHVCKTIAENDQLLQLLNVKTINKKTKQKKSLDDIEEILEGKYTPIIREGKAKEDGTTFPPLFKCKTRRDNKSHKIETYCQVHKDFVQFDDDNIQTVFHAAIECRCIILVSHIWIIGGRFGVSLKLMRCKLYPRQQHHYEFRDSDEDDEVEKVQEVDDDDEEEEIEF